MKSKTKIIILGGFVLIIFTTFLSNSSYASNWPYTVDGLIWAQPLVADFENDNNPEMLVATNGYYNLYSIDRSGNLLWKYHIGWDAIYKTPVIADLNNDGICEILLTCKDRYLYCLSKDGQVIWSYNPAEDNYSAIFSGPVAVDLDNDGEIEIVATGRDGLIPEEGYQSYLYALNKDGQLKWKFKLENYSENLPSIGDLDGDGKSEILVIALENSQTENTLYCVNSNGQLVWKYEHLALAHNITTEVWYPVLGDLDNNGDLEILLATGNKIYCIDKNGSLIWEYETSSYYPTAPVVADLNGDGKLEVLFGTEIDTPDNNNLYCLSNNGQLVWKYPTSNLYREDMPASPVVADLDGNGSLEIIATSRDRTYSGLRYINCLNGGGELIWRKDLDPSGLTPPTLADLDGDGSLEILFGVFDWNNHKVQCINKDGQVFIPSLTQGSIDPMPWPMFQHDSQHTGFYSRNKAPSLDLIGDKEVSEGNLLEFSISATDPNNDSLIYSVANLPEGATFDLETRTFNWTPDYSQAGVYKGIKFIVSDGSLTDKEVITITVNNTNRSPVISPIGNKSVDEGSLLQFTIQATDPDGDAVTCSALNLPQGANINSQVGTFSWTPNYLQAGSYIVTFLASDGSLSAGETITITVNNVNGPPVFDSIGNKIALRGEWLRFNVHAVDPDGDKITYGILNKPHSAYFCKRKGLFMWKPNIHVTGNFTVTFIAKDTKGHQAYETITITVPNVAPVLDPIGNKTIKAGQWLIFRLIAHDADSIDNGHLHYYAENLPKGASLSKYRGLFMWKPNRFQRGSYQLRFYVKDPPGAIAEEIIKITVN